MKIVKFILVAVTWMLLIFIGVSLVGCKAKRIEHTIFRTDTIKTSSIIKIIEPQITDLFIDKPCDSLGNLKPFNYTFGSGKTKTVLKAVNDTIYLEQNIDSIVNSKIDTYKASSVKEKEIFIQYKNKKLMWWSLFANFVLLIWTFRKVLVRFVKPF
jgi:hypothetical protein